MANFREPTRQTTQQALSGRPSLILAVIGLSAAFVVGVIGPSAEPVRILFWVAGTLTLIALVLGIVGALRPKQGGATNRLRSLTGAVLAGLATVWYIHGVVTLTDTFHQASCSTSPTEAPPADGALSFHTSRCYKDGMQVTVSAPKPFTVPESASGHAPGNRAVSVEITFRNGSVGVLDLDLHSCGAKDAHGRQAEPIYHGDEEHGGNRYLLPGMTEAWHCEFSLPPNAANSMQVEAGVMHYREAVWSGAVPQT
ncbi:hypothetical protein ABZ851_31580 [Streptomyces sp. NPDC047049]|uniref:hypothetical protein n=1 Tax=Streptomyces sp. NPDC047049 TaxID=3156688 RepID=UPI003409AAAD